VTLAILIASYYYVAMSVSESLIPFGFTALESEIYVFLLKASPATGYRIAQGINKPAANTYKAIQTLQAKGAVLVEDGPSRLCRAVPLHELMSRLQKDFESRRKSTEKLLRSLNSPIDDDRIYRLKSRQQVLGKVREMVSATRSLCLLKLPAEVLAELEPDMENAALRGVAISCLTSQPISVEGIDTVYERSEMHGAITAVADGAQVLVGETQTGDEADAIWTQSAVLARLHHVSLSAEICLAHVHHLLDLDEKKSRVQRAVESRIALPQNFQEETRKS
jgi:sugar-specific transcriptional regulator TrmB